MLQMSSTNGHVKSQGSAQGVYIAMNSVNSSSPKEFEQLESHILTSQNSRPTPRVEDKTSSSAHKYARFTSQSSAELFGTTLQAEKGHSKSMSNQGVYDRFRTRSTRFDGQFSREHSVRHGQAGIGEASDSEDDGDEDSDGSSVQPGRYFDALHGPELDELRDHEVLILPKDELWPFLLRFPLNCFGVCLGLGSQAILWKRLSLSPELGFLRIPKEINLFLWCLALLALLVISITYGLKVLLYFGAVRREFFHPVRVNFFFAPWIAGMFLALSLPPCIAESVHPAIFCCLMTPIFILELKLYGQWLSGGKRRLSKVANPSTHLSIVGNFVGALLGATVNWHEPAIFFWSVGLAHYLVLFVTLYQRLPTNESLPKDLHPVYFLFVATPSTASVAWMHITGNFDFVSRIVFFIALFLYSSLVFRINFFRGIRFSFSWWAYTFPMAGAAMASIEYSHAAPSWITRILAVVLSLVSSATVLALFCITLLHAFVWKTLFQNDNAIAITAQGTRNQQHRKQDIRHTFDGVTLENERLHKVVLNHIHNVISKDHYSSS